MCRENKKFAEGYDYAERGLTISLPTGGLFVVSWVYDYALLDEFAVNAYWIERYQDCLEACERLLREGKISDDMRQRVEQNARFARAKLSARKTNTDKERTASPPISPRILTEREVSGEASTSPLAHSALRYSSALHHGAGAICFAVR